MSSPPVKYQRFFDFTTFAANNPDKPLPGNAVDVEFNRLKATTDQTIDRLNLIQRDDGKLADGAITSNSIADGAVTTSKIADGAVTTPKLADGSVTAPKLAPGAIGGGALADGSVTTAKIADGAITQPKMAVNSVGTPQLIDGSVTQNKLALLSVGTPQLIDGAVTNAKLGLLSVATGNLQDLSVTSAKIALLAITTGLIADGAVTQPKLALLSVGTPQLIDGAVTAAKLAPNAVGSANIIDGSIDPTDFSAASISLITSAGNPRGAWAPATNYASKDAVTNGSGVYVALVAHTSGASFATDLAAGKWYQTGSIFDQNLNKADTVQFAKVGIGMVPVNILDITQSGVNGAAQASILNANAGNGSYARYLLNNGTNQASLVLYGEGYTPAGMFQPGYAAVSTSKGLCLQCQTGPILFAANGAAEMMRLDTSGRLGIGVVPANVLDITASGANAGQTAQLLNANAGNTSWARFNASNGTNSVFLIQYGQNYNSAGILQAGYGGIASTSGLFLYSGASLPILFATNGSVTEKMRLNSNGALLIGTGATWGSEQVRITGPFTQTYFGGRIVHMTEGHAGVANGWYPMFHVPTGAWDCTFVHVKVFSWLDNLQAYYCRSYHEAIFILCNTSGNAMSQVNVLQTSNLSLNSSVISMVPQMTFTVNGAEIICQWNPNIGGTNGSGGTAQFFVEAEIVGTQDYLVTAN